MLHFTIVSDDFFIRMRKLLNQLLAEHVECQNCSKLNELRANSNYRHDLLAGELMEYGEKLTEDSKPDHYVNIADRI